MARKYWIGVIARDHAVIAARQGVCAFSHGKESAARKLSPGDRFAFYSPKTGVADGDTVQAFTAIGMVKDGDAFPATWADTEMTAWVRNASFVPAQETPIKPMLEDLSFITNPRYWGMAFRRSLFEVSEADFTKIATAMGAAL